MTTSQFDPTSPLKPTGNLRRRAAVSRLVELGAIASAGLAVAGLAIVVFSVAHKGASALSFDFFTQAPPKFGGAGGGIVSAIIGTTLIVAFGAMLATPIGVLTGVYLTEFAGPRSRTGSVLKLALDLLQGVPTIVVGLFVFGLLVAGGGHESGFAGSVALAIIMLPLIARASQEVLLLVPSSLREAADALGVTRWRTVMGVILPAAMGGIVTGTILAVARAAGETAPLLVVCGLADPSKTTFDLFGQPLPNIPVLILQLVEEPDPSGLVRAWGAALGLLTVILLANVGARVLLARSRRKMGQ
jgi:phosphate transport system permease protein